MVVEEDNEADGALIGQLEIRLGNLEFSGKGQQAWLAEQLRTMVAAIPTLGTTNLDASHGKGGQDGASGIAAPKFEISLATHIKTKGAEGNQTQRFLVAADWLRQRGAQTLSTSAVSKALIDNQQSRLANPADCLNKNVSKGFCEKISGGGFYITPEGLKELGYS